MTDPAPLPPWLRACVLLMLAFFTNAAIAQESVTRRMPSMPAACKKMSGTYAVADVVSLTDSQGYAGVVTQVTHDDYLIGQPVFTVCVGAEEITSTGVLSGNVRHLRPAAHIPSAALFGTDEVGCALSGIDDYDGYLQQVRVRNLSQEDRQALAGYLGALWRTEVDPNDLRRIRDFLVINESMTGVMNLYLVMPLRKL
ncbi:MAG: hypothetical protein LBL59_05965 [Xanthomonadaceae bacterium]|jgi:hypothetical protein|nr:hypothetical protein [Xanthomonadaceae bacterium]